MFKKELPLSKYSQLDVTMWLNSGQWDEYEKGVYEWVWERKQERMKESRREGAGREDNRKKGEGSYQCASLDFCFPFHYDWEILMRLGTAVMNSRDGS